MIHRERPDTRGSKRVSFFTSGMYDNPQNHTMKTRMRRFAVLVALLCAKLAIAGSPGLDPDGSGSEWDDFTRAAKLFAQHGTPQEILVLCEKIQKTTKDPVLCGRAVLLQAEVLVDQQSYEKAHTVLQNFYRDKHDLPAALAQETRLRDGQIYAWENKPERAAALFREVAIADKPESNSMWQQEAEVALAWQAADANRWPEADSLLTLLSKNQILFGSDERLLVLRARAAMARGDVETAVRLLSDSQEKYALGFLAKAYEQANKPIMAVGVYKKLSDRYPGSAEAEDAAFQAGEVFMRAGDWLAARAEFNRLLEVYPQTPRAPAVHFRLGWIYLQLNQFDEALNAFRTGSTPEYRSYFSYMEAECLRRTGADQPERLQQAISIDNGIATMDLRSPLAPLAKVKAALTMLEKGDSTDAVITLRQFLSLYPKDDLVPAVMFLLATHVDPSQPGLAQQYFNAIAGPGQPGSGEIYDAAVFSLQQQDYAAQKYQQVINRNTHLQQPDSSDVPNFWQRAHRLLLAESAYYLQQYEQAQNAYAAVADGGDDELADQAALGLAWCKLQSNQPDSAAHAFRSLRNRVETSRHETSQHETSRHETSRRDVSTRYVQASFGLATALFRMKQYEEALKIYPTALVAGGDPTLAVIAAKSLYRAAECYYRLEYYIQGIEMWEKLVHDFPSDPLAPQAKYQVADTYFRANHFTDAKAAFQALITDYPDDPLAAESALRLAQCSYNAAEYNEAIQEYEQFIAQYPKHERSKDALEGLQLCYFQMGQTEQATAALEKVVTQFPNADLAADARFRIASSYLQAGNYQHAVVAFKEILTQYPGSSYAMDAQFALARAYLAGKDFESANKEFLRFTQYFPDSPQMAEAVYYLGVGYFSQDSYLTASDYFDKIIKQYPESEFLAGAQQNIGWCFDRLGERERALQHFEKFLQVQPDGQNGDAAKIQLQVARLQNDLGKTQAAILILQKLQSHRDSDIAAEAACRLGAVYIAQQKSAPALAAFKTAVQQGKRENYYRLSALAQMATIYDNSGDVQRAIAAYKLLANSTTEERWVNAALERIKTLSPKLAAQ